MPAGWRTAGTPVRQQQIRVPARRLLVEVRVRRMRHRQDAGSRQARTQMIFNGPGWRAAHQPLPHPAHQPPPHPAHQPPSPPHPAQQPAHQKPPHPRSSQRSSSRRPAHQPAQQLAQQPPVFRCSGVPVMRPVFRHHHRDHHRAVMSIRGRAAPHTFRLPPPFPGHIWSPRAFRFQHLRVLEGTVECGTFTFHLPPISFPFWGLKQSSRAFLNSKIRMCFQPEFTCTCTVPPCSMVMSGVCYPAWAGAAGHGRSSEAKMK